MRALVLLALLAGCAGAPPALPAAAPLIPTARGVDVPGTGRGGALLEIGFGRALEGAEVPLRRLYDVRRRPCGAGGAVLLAGGIEMHFPQGTFTGWRTAGAQRGRLCR